MLLAIAFRLGNFDRIPLISPLIISEPDVLNLADALENAFTSPALLTVLSWFIADLNEPIPLVLRPDRLGIKFFKRLASEIELETAPELNPETDTDYALRDEPIEPTLKLPIPLVSSPAKLAMKFFKRLAEDIELDTVPVSIPST